MCSLHALTFSFLIVGIHEEYAAKPALKPTNNVLSYKMYLFQILDETTKKIFMIPKLILEKFHWLLNINGHREYINGHSERQWSERK